MSPKNKKRLDQIRRKLDILDSKLIDLIKIRTSLVDQVTKQKVLKKEIVDKKRINKILKNIRKKSLQQKIDPKITRRIWFNMIYSYIDFEKRNFKKKSLEKNIDPKITKRIWYNMIYAYIDFERRNFKKK
mgnify:CR=1 FL=1